MWSDGGHVNIALQLAASFGEFHVPSDFDNRSSSDATGLVSFHQRTVPDLYGSWVDIVVWYIGSATRGSWSVSLDVELMENQFSCRLPVPRVQIPLILLLEAASTLPETVVTVVETLAVVGVVTPTGLIRGATTTSQRVDVGRFTV